MVVAVVVVVSLDGSYVPSFVNSHGDSNSRGIPYCCSDISFQSLFADCFVFEQGYMIRASSLEANDSRCPHTGFILRCNRHVNNNINNNNNISCVQMVVS